MSSVVENLYYLEVFVKTINLQVNTQKSIKISVDFCKTLEFDINQDEGEVQSDTKVHIFNQGCSVLFFESYKRFIEMIKQEPLILSVYHCDKIIGSAETWLNTDEDNLEEFIATRPITIDDRLTLKKYSTQVGTIRVFIRCTSLGSKIVSEDLNETAIVTKIKEPILLKKRQSPTKKTMKTSNKLLHRSATDLSPYSSSHSQVKEMCKICVTCQRLHNLTMRSGDALHHKNVSSMCACCKTFIHGMRVKPLNAKHSCDKKCNICSMSNDLLIKKLKVLKKNGQNGLFRSRNESSSRKVINKYC